MRLHHFAACSAAGLLGTALLCTSATARAQDAGAPLCSSYNHGNVLYFSGSTAVQPVMQTLSKALATAGVDIGIVYMQGVGSCVGLADMLSAQKEKGMADYLAPDGTSKPQCTLTDMTGGQAIDVAVADVFPSTCTTIGVAQAFPATGYKDFLGPIQVMTMVTRKESTESSISADAAYTVFGFAGQAPYQVAPWTDPTQMFIRGTGSGTINMIGTAIGLAATKWLPGAQYTVQHVQNSGVVLSSLQGAANVNASIGIVAADYADAYRNPTTGAALKILAYKHTGQTCGYLPDSDATHYDKINVRQGRYAIWGPVHIVAPVDATGTATNPMVATILQYFASVGRTPDATLTTAQKQSMIDAEADAFTVPWCAMQVERTGEISTPVPFAPTEPCGCYYESHKASMVTACTACADDTSCSGATPKCRYGFCEAR